MVREAFLEEGGRGFTEAGVLLGGLRPLWMPWLTAPTPAGPMFQVQAMVPLRLPSRSRHQSPSNLAL